MIMEKFGAIDLQLNQFYLVKTNNDDYHYSDSGFVIAKASIATKFKASEETKKIVVLETCNGIIVENMEIEGILPLCRFKTI